MSKTIKFLTYSILIIIFIWVLLAIILASFGLETKRFNPLIIEQVKKYDDNLNLDIKKVKVYLHIGVGNITNPK